MAEDLSRDELLERLRLAEAKVAELSVRSTEATTEATTENIDDEIFIRGIKKSKWFNLRQIIRYLVCIIGATIFGGCATTFAIREHYEKLYRKFCIPDQTYDEIDDETNEKHREICRKLYREVYLKNYNNPLFHPESFEGRNMIPNDIDVSTEQNKMEPILEYLRKSYIVDEIKVTGCPYFLNERTSASKAIIFRRFRISIIKPSYKVTSNLSEIFGISNMHNLLSNFNIDLDFVILRDSYSRNNIRPPFNQPDFRCNLLELRPGSKDEYILATSYVSTTLERNISFIERAKQAIKDLETVFQDNIDKRALVMVASNPPNYKRIEKMLKKGYSIDLSEFLQIRERFPLKPITDEDKCYICQEEVTDSRSDVSNPMLDVIKPCTECSGLTHLLCFAEHMENGLVSLNRHDIEPRCGMCRTPFSKYRCQCDIMKLIFTIEDCKENLATGGTARKIPQSCDFCQ
uniref:Uncharacterized protein n=1 Tax=viral metagenome TaxID=1070528 RepID=A0A6C0EYE4_9ZZZZ